MKIRYLIPLALAACVSCLHSQTFIDPGFTGTTQFDGWENLNATNFPGYGGYPGSAAWPSPIGSNVAGSGSGELNKTAGNGYPLAGSSGNFIYVTQSGAGTSDPDVAVGSFSVSDSNVVTGLQNVFFQTLMGAALQIGGEYVEFASGIYPVLNYNGGSQGLMATFTNLFWEGEIEADQGEGYGYLRGFQWNLSEILDPISSISITWSNTNHAQIYGLQLNQSDVYSAVPEPSTWALLGLSALMLIVWQRRRKASGI